MGSAHGVLNTDVCIIGAGPHGLAARLLFKRLAPSTSVTVIDRSCDWLAAWNRQFEHAQIDVLRSPIVHHPFPDALELEISELETVTRRQVFHITLLQPSVLRLSVLRLFAMQILTIH